MRCNFNPRSPMRGATIVVFDPSLAIIFQSTLPYAGSDQASPFAQIAAAISIHAPLCGERRGRRYLPNGDAKISIHAPLCGERHACNFFHDECFQFQSTLPYAGSDLSKGPETPTPSNFNPRSPMRGATVRPGHFFQRVEISIHAPLCGERPVPFFGLKDLVEFQSTLPYAGSDMCCDAALHSPAISIHAPLCGERPANGNIYLKKLIISIHAPLCGERPRVATKLGKWFGISIHAPLCGERPRNGEIPERTIQFQSTLPYAGSDSFRTCSSTNITNFNPRSPMRGATVYGRL